ncbi:hypothetical protein GE09DRAFT_1048375 [Coniochaeta sp. 2T2.1]|nr:hypothetical protein GE09DRAFT_1048375 [Coniochaeta sp. 2T2.1]
MAMKARRVNNDPNKTHPFNKYGGFYLIDLPYIRTPHPAGVPIPDKLTIILDLRERKSEKEAEMFKNSFVVCQLMRQDWTRHEWEELEYTEPKQVEPNTLEHYDFGQYICEIDPGVIAQPGEYMYKIQVKYRREDSTEERIGDVFFESYQFLIR